MIVLGAKQKLDPVALRKRKAYVQTLLDEPANNASPSSQEWVSPEFAAGHRSILLEEIDEIDAQLKKLAKKRKRK